MLLKKTSRGTQRVLFGHRDHTKLWAESNLVFCGFRFSWTGNFGTDEKTSVFGKVTASCCESRLAVRVCSEVWIKFWKIQSKTMLIWRQSLLKGYCTVAMLCLVYHTSVVTLSLQQNLLSLGASFISLSNNIPFVRHSLDELHNREVGDIPKRSV